MHYPEELHVSVGRLAEIETECNVIREWAGERETDVRDGGRVGDIDVIDLVITVELSDGSIAWDNESEGELRHSKNVLYRSLRKIKINSIIGIREQSGNPMMGASGNYE